MANMHSGMKGLFFASFAAGILLAFCVPDKMMLFILSAMVVILGFISCRR